MTKDSERAAGIEVHPKPRAAGFFYNSAAGQFASTSFHIFG
ncbi:hypothetical protein [Campylobacter sp.]|nr:hypothetical protein [Campylobacter sp.]MDD7090290.1 hypothetical protein [Campylobacteraceae bacterium]MDY5285017.1 hypothetical protein [Campylobacter sp.]